MRPNKLPVSLSTVITIVNLLSFVWHSSGMGESAKWIMALAIRWWFETGTTTWCVTYAFQSMLKELSARSSTTIPKIIPQAILIATGTGLGLKESKLKLSRRENNSNFTVNYMELHVLKNTYFKPKKLKDWIQIDFECFYCFYCLISKGTNQKIFRNNVSSNIFSIL